MASNAFSLLFLISRPLDARSRHDFAAKSPYNKMHGLIFRGDNVRMVG